MKWLQSLRAIRVKRLKDKLYIAEQELEYIERLISKLKPNEYTSGYFKHLRGRANDQDEKVRTLKMKLNANR